MNYMSFLKVIGDRVSRAQRTLQEKPLYARIIVCALVILSVALGVAIRIAPMSLNGFEFFEFDSYIEYWQAKYVYENGPLAWYTLTRENPDTHIFWYPWGRDFIYTSYPLLPIWIGLSYHVVKYTGLTLQEWASLQPIIFAAVAVALAYFVARELTGSMVAGVLASLFMAILPAAVERSVVGFVEKEGVAAVFIFLFMYFYTKLLKATRDGVVASKKIIYVVLASLFLGMVGWLWGGFVFILGTVVSFFVISPLLVRKYVTRSFVLYNLLTITLAMVFATPSPSNAKTLGLYPPSVRGLGLPLIAASLLPLLFYFFGVEYKRVGLRRSVLTPGRYFLILVLAVIAGVALVMYEVLPISGRLAWALGLRFMPVQPLVESIAEHRSPLAPEAVGRMLHDWGVPAGHEYLIVASPLILGVLGALYMLYKGEPEKVYVAIGFILSFYSYLNAAYMIATAAYFAIPVVSTMVSRILQGVFPPLIVHVDKRKKRAVYTRGRVDPKIRIIALAYLTAVFAALIMSAYFEFITNSNTIYHFKSGLAGIRAYNDSWYKAIEALRKTPEDAVIITWWDYGYGISVLGGRASVADGSTINNTQIGIIGLIMSSNSTEKAARLAKLFKVRPNHTYIMVFEGALVVEQPNGLSIWPILAGGLPGIVDIPKSLWMIRIGNSVVEELQAKGVSVNYIDTSRFLYLYGNILSPPFDKPNEIPLLYRLIVDAVLYWAETNGKKAEFCWFSGPERYLDVTLRNNIYEQLRINVSKAVDPTTTSCVSVRPLADDPYIVPYEVILEPYRDPRTGEPVRVTFLNREGVLYSIIVIYKFASLPE
ncbi:MAG: STT3 domain-containing protein [Desulfurococcaceae archaeon]